MKLTSTFSKEVLQLDRYRKPEVSHQTWTCSIYTKTVEMVLVVYKLKIPLILKSKIEVDYP